jgi:hypothetical protein
LGVAFDPAAGADLGERDPRRRWQDIGHGWGVRSEVARGRLSGLVVERLFTAGTLDLKLPAPDEPAPGGEPEEESEA